MHDISIISVNKVTLVFLANLCLGSTPDVYFATAKIDKNHVGDFARITCDLGYVLPSGEFDQLVECAENRENVGVWAPPEQTRCHRKYLCVKLRKEF